MSRKLWLVAIVASLVSGSAGATPITSFATGNDLDGATLFVRFSSGFEATALLVGDGLEGATGEVAGTFSFALDGSTFTSGWALTNDRVGDSIVLARFDVSSSVSVFDDGSSPSTPGSGNGDEGVLPSQGPVPLSSGESVPWPDAMNTGDIFLVQTITWDAADFTFGERSRWLDDTDVVPDPSTTALVLAGLALAAIRRTRAA